VSPVGIEPTTNWTHVIPAKGLQASRQRLENRANTDFSARSRVLVGCPQRYREHTKASAHGSEIKDAFALTRLTQ